MMHLLADILPAASQATPPGLRLADRITTVTTDIAIIIVVAGIFLCVARLLKGPHLADRALAADTIAVHLVALVALFTMRFETLAFFDGALAISLLGFATTIAMAQYIIRRRLRRLGLQETPARNEEVGS